MVTEWSSYQLAIFDQANSQQNLLIQARAGSGKTTTIVELVKRIDRKKSVMFVAFNKRIVGELKTRISAPNCQIVTTHSAGFAIIRAAYPKIRLDDAKGREIARAVLEDHGRATIGYANPSELGSICKIVAMAKATLASKAEMDDMAFDLADNGLSPGQLAAMAWETLRRGQDSKESLDFDDMVFWPTALHLKARQPVDVVIVDEAQDLSLCQIDLIRRFMKPGGRVVAVGDSAQAIYQFRGADHGSMDRIRSEFKCEVLPLSVCYRCPRSVVEACKTWCPDIEAAPNAREGEVTPVAWEHMVAEAKAGDFIISRKNAPLVGLCFAFMRRGIPAQVAGKDLAKGLLSLIEKSKAETIPALVAWVESYRDREMKRLLKTKNPEAKLEGLADKLDCLQVLTEGEDSVADLCNKIGRMFTDTTAGDGAPLATEHLLILTTVHKAKGLERKRVWKLEHTFTGFRRMTLDQQKELDNLHYVACSRAQESLFLVEEPRNSIGG